MALTTGQELVLQDYLHDFISHDTFEPKRDVLLTTCDIIFELQDMCDMEVNDVADYMATNGYHYVRWGNSSMHGWCLERVTEDSELM